MKKQILPLCVLFLGLSVFAQDPAIYKTVISDLSSKKFEGRGYYKKGDVNAAKYIAGKFESMGVKPYTEYFQDFSFPVNTFNGNMMMTVDGKELVSAKDFVMREFSSGVNGQYNLYYIDTLNYNYQKIMEDLKKDENKNSFVVVDFMFFHQHGKELSLLYKAEIPGIIMKWSEPLKYYKAYSSQTIPIAEIWVSPDFPNNAKSVNVNIENKMIDDYKTKNVIAYIEGENVADSFYIFTAHFDHIGHMGKEVYAPGANDNASGVAMLFTLADYYSKPENKPKYSMMFIAFAGEETGLRGAYHYTKNPLFPLENIKFLCNLDMIADNPDSIYVEISASAKNGLDLMKKLNSKNKYFAGFEEGELQGNSDHYPFAMKNVPSIFFMMKGDAFKVYHTPQDNTDNIYLENFPKLFKLVTDFVANY
jgi:hypothetical protein